MCTARRWRPLRNRRQRLRQWPQKKQRQRAAKEKAAGRRPLVVAGTHGKTTTASLAAWVYTDCGRDPGYLIGGVPVDLGRSFQSGTGDRFIIEGDEYNAAYFDRGPKFLHYRPQTLILTSVEYDHADLYPDPASLITVSREGSRDSRQRRHNSSIVS